MKTTWIITSAINTSVGVLDANMRIFQTHETISSIKAFYPDARFILAEGGKHLDGSNDYFDEVKGRCDLFMDLRDNGQIQYLHSNVFDRAPVHNKGGMVGLSK